MSGPWQASFSQPPFGWASAVERDGGLECPRCLDWIDVARLAGAECPECGEPVESAFATPRVSRSPAPAWIRWTGPGVGRDRRFEIVQAWPSRGGLEEAIANDLDLGRQVRLVHCRHDPIGRWRAFFDRAATASRLDHPGVLSIHRVLALPEGGALVVLAELPGALLPARAARRIVEEPRRLAALAHAIASAQAMGVEPPPLELESIRVAGEESRLAGWERPVFSDSTPTAVRLGRFLLKVLAAAALDGAAAPDASGSRDAVARAPTTSSRRRRDSTASLRQLSQSSAARRGPGTRPRSHRMLRGIARAALRGAFSDAAELAAELERYAEGDPVRVAWDDPRRSFRRLVRRRPVLAAALGSLAAGLLLAGAALGGSILAERSRRASAVEGLVAAAAARIEEGEPVVDAALREAAAAGGDRRELLAAVRAAYHARRSLQPDLEERRLARALASARQRRADALLAARPWLERIEAEGRDLEGAATAGDRVRGAGVLAASRLAALELEEVEHEFEVADFEEEKRLSTRTLDLLEATAGFHQALREWDRAPPGTLPSPPVETPLAAPAGRLARLLASRRAELLADPGLRARAARLVERLEPAATLVVPDPPPGTILELLAVRSGPVASLESAGPLPAGVRRIRAGHWLVRATRGAEAFDLPILARRAERVELALELPDEVPAGFVYVAPTFFYRGGDEGYNPTRYRRDRIRRGFFLARAETTFAQYREYLLDRQAAGTLSGAEVPRLGGLPVLAGAGLDFHPQLARDLARYGLGWDHPVRGLRLSDMIEYAEWRSRRSGGAWRFHVPSEAEWEVAARGVAGRLYPWGDVLVPERANVGANPAYRTFGPAGTPPEDRSIHGVLGLGGNARERTTTRFGEDDEDLFAVKGGYANCLDVFVPACSRHGHARDDRMPQDGFRLAAVRAGS